MRFLFFLPVVLFTLLPLTAQNALRDDFNGVYYDPSMYMQRYSIEDGSPYLDLEFKPAKIGEREKDYLVRFNAYEGSVEVWIRANKVVELQSKGEERIKMLDGSKKEYIIAKYKDQKGEVKTGFLEELSSNEKYSLYLRERIKYFKKTKAEGYAKAKPARFEKTAEQFYLKLPNNKTAIFLPGNKKKFLSVFGPKNASKAKAFIKKKRLNLSKADDIQSVLAHIYGG